MLREMILDSRSVRYLFMAINLCNGYRSYKKRAVWLLYSCCIVLRSCDQTCDMYYIIHM